MCIEYGIDYHTVGCKKSADPPTRCVHFMWNHSTSYKG